MRTNLKLLRVKHKLTQAQMGERLGYSRNHYARIENGEQGASIKLVSSLQEAFGLSIDEAMKLIENDGE